jgi:two-component system cell cycle response regulator
MNERPNTVLLIEGSADDARLTESLLNEGGRGAFKSLWAPSLSDGLGRLAEGGVDLVLLALDLPDSKGPRTFDDAYRRFPEVPIVLLADESDEGQALELLKRGAQEYLVKNQTDGRLMVRCLRHAVERHRLVREIQALSLVDDLTGLHNRRGFIALAQQQQRVSERKGDRFYVLYVDLDNMKWINDNLGHHFGDQALIDLGEVLESTFRGSDVVARVGGDEFVVLVTDAEEADVSALQERLANNLRAHSARKSRPFDLHVCTGVARYEPGAGQSIDEIVDRADKLMYRQKRERKAS